MSIEDLAKRDLFDEYELEMVPIYDPYRSNNILKDSNKIQENFPRSTLNEFLQQKDKNQKRSKKNSQNNRHSLKRLLERLESQPSPDKKLRKLPNPKLKTLGVISSTQPIVISKNKSIFTRTGTEEKKIENDHQMLTIKMYTPASCHSKAVSDKRQDEQTRVRNMIKKKLAQKQSIKSKNKAEKLVNFLRQNNLPIVPKKKSNNLLKTCSRKLINFLS